MPFKKGQIVPGAIKFKPGETGNPLGRPKKIPEIDELLADVLSEEKDGINAAKAILMALRSKATKGDVRAIEVILDRAYGKARQTTELLGSLEINKVSVATLPDGTVLEL